MKRVLTLSLVFILLFSLAGCGMIKEDFEIPYGTKEEIKNDVFDKYDEVVWETSDPAVASVKKGIVTAVGPGSAEITATANEKIIATYQVSVTTIPVTSIVLSTNNCEIAEEESYQLYYTLFPENASDYGLSWKSANEEVATVDSRGKIQAKAVGQTTISISNKDGFVATCSVTVTKAKPDLKAIFDEYCSSDWATVNADGTYLTVDTNPYNRDDYTDYVAYISLYTINEALGLPDSLIEKMGKTRALDGRQSQTFDSITVSWSYHPDRGLEVIYEVN